MHFSSTAYVASTCPDSYVLSPFIHGVSTSVFMATQYLILSSGTMFCADSSGRGRKSLQQSIAARTRTRALARKSDVVRGEALLWSHPVIVVWKVLGASLIVCGYL